MGKLITMHWKKEDGPNNTKTVFPPSPFCEELLLPLSLFPTKKRGRNVERIQRVLG